MPELTLRKQYQIKVIQWTDLTAAVQKYLLPLLQPQVRFNGHTERKGEILKYETLEELLSSDLNETDVNLSWNDKDWNASISLASKDFLGAGVVELTLTLDSNLRTKALEVIAEFEAELAITEYSDKDREAMLRLRYEYVNDSFDARSALKHIKQIFKPFINDPELDLELVERGEGGLRSSSSVKTDDLPASTDEVERVSVRMYDHYGPLFEVELCYNAGRYATNTITCQCEPRIKSQVKEAIGELELAIGLTPYEEQDDEVPFHGEERLHFTQSGIKVDLDWFQQFLNTLDKHITVPTYFSARLSFNISDTTAVTYGDQAKLLERLKADWDDVIQVIVVKDGYDHRLTASIEPRLDWVHLKLSMRDKTDTVTTLTNLAKELHLQCAERNPYSHPRTQKTYRIGHFDRVRFATLVQNIIGDVGRIPILIDSFVSELKPGGELENIYFDDLDAILTRVAGGKDFSSLKLSIRKPKGEAISFSINEDHSELVVQSSYHPDRFADIKRSLMRQMSLSEPNSEKDANDRKRGLFAQAMRLEGLPGKLVVLILAGLSAIGGFFFERIVPDISVTLTVPRAEGTSPAKLQAGCVDVIWVVKRDKWLSDASEKLDAVGTVTLARIDASKTVHLKKHQSGDKVHVAPGDWDIFVFDPLLERTSPAVRVTVEDVNYSKRKAEFVSKCGPTDG